jgi:pimeloyl-ACP methyl ester carboxylesterase
MNLETRHFAGSLALCYGEGPANGPTLLLLHGVTRCWREWEQLLPELTQHWRVLAFDHRGHGGSDRAADYLVADYVSDAVRFVREVVAGPVVILGHSLGAMVAAGVAAGVPELVRAIILEDPPFHTMGRRIAGSAWEAQFIGVREVGRRGGTIEELADALADIRIPMPGGGFKRFGELRNRTALLWGAECLQQLDAELLTPVIEGRWLDGYDLAQIVARIRCPVLLLQGDSAAGGTLTDEDVELAQRHIADCRVIRFPGIGHQIHREQLDAMLRATRDFAASLPLDR